MLGHHDLLKLVLGKVSLMDLCAATAVCRQWRDVARSDDFWCDVDFEAPVKEHLARERDGRDPDARFGSPVSPGSSRRFSDEEHQRRRVMAHQVSCCIIPLRLSAASGRLLVWLESRKSRRSGMRRMLPAQSLLRDRCAPTYFSSPDPPTNLRALRCVACGLRPAWAQSLS